MSLTPQQILAAAHFSVHEDAFLLVRLPPMAVVAVAAVIAELADPFITLIVDAREITLILDQESFEEYRHRLPNAEVAQTTYRLLTLDHPLTSDIVGLLAMISQALAEAQIPVFALSAYAYDHWLVPAHHATQALEVLHQLQTSLRSA